MSADDAALDALWNEDGLLDAISEALRPRLARMLADARAGALREFADTRGVNVGDEDSEWWKGYRQAQRECLHDAVDAAAAQIGTSAPICGDDSTSAVSQGADLRSGAGEGAS